MPLMAKGIDHTALLAMSVTSALGKLLSLTEEQAAHAIGIAGSTFNTTVTTRASYTYEWKGFASSLVALGCTNIVLLAKEGVTGPVTYFEGPMGFKEEFGMDPVFDCAPGDFSRIKKCILKSYNAEVHTQPAIEAMLELREQYGIQPADVEEITATTFLTAFHIVGGGKYGSRKTVQTKEQADHSLPYLLAVALLDGEVKPPQLLPERIRRADVQALLQKVQVSTALPVKTPRKIVEKIDPYTAPYPEKMDTKICVKLKDGKEHCIKKEDYKGFYTRPLGWDDVIAKFHRLGESSMEADGRNEIIRIVQNLENEDVGSLVNALTATPIPV
jgi:2-methylcitrate dehydratase